MKRNHISIITAVLFAVIITWIDTRPNWDDTGFTAGLLFLSAAACGVWSPFRPWLLGLIIGGIIFVTNLVLSGNYESVIAFAGAYAGAIHQRDKCIEDLSNTTTIIC